jgi:hypothetical protein
VCRDHGATTSLQVSTQQLLKESLPAAIESIGGFIKKP